MVPKTEELSPLDTAKDPSAEDWCSVPSAADALLSPARTVDFLRPRATPPPLAALNVAASATTFGKAKNRNAHVIPCSLVKFIVSLLNMIPSLLWNRVLKDCISRRDSGILKLLGQPGNFFRTTVVPDPTLLDKTQGEKAVEPRNSHHVLLVKVRRHSQVLPEKHRLNLLNSLFQSGSVKTKSSSVKMTGLGGFR